LRIEVGARHSAGIVAQRAFGASYQPSANSHQLFVSVMRMASLGQGDEVARFLKAES
jgi:hypothetical protein